MLLIAVVIAIGTIGIIAIGELQRQGIITERANTIILSLVYIGSILAIVRISSSIKPPD